MDAQSYTRAMRERRMNLYGQATTFLDGIKGRDMNAEEQAQWKRYNDEIEEIDAHVRGVVEQEQRERDANLIRETEHANGFGTHRSTWPGPDQSDVLRRFLRGDTSVGYFDGNSHVLEIPVDRAARELQMLRDGATAQEVRALAWDTGSVASAVPTSMARTLYQYLEASNGMWRAPTTKITTSSGEPMLFPRLGAHSIATQVSGQGTVLAGTDPTFLKTQLDAYKYGELVRVANEVIQDTAVDIMAFLGADLGRAMGRVTATDLVLGNGTGKPNGLMNALLSAGSVTTGGSLLGASYEKLIDLQYSVVDEYRMGSSGWLMKDSTTASLRKLRDGAGGTIGAVLWEPSLTNGLQGGQPDRLLGDPVWRDSNVAAMGSNARIMAYGDFSAYYIRTVGNVVIEVDKSRYFDTDETAIRAKWRIDGDLMDTNAFASMLQNV